MSDPGPSTAPAMRKRKRRRRSDRDGAKRRRSGEMAEPVGEATSTGEPEEGERTPAGDGTREAEPSKPKKLPRGFVKRVLQNAQSADPHAIHVLDPARTTAEERAACPQCRKAAKRARHAMREKVSGAVKRRRKSKSTRLDALRAIGSANGDGAVPPSAMPLAPRTSASPPRSPIRAGTGDEIPLATPREETPRLPSFPPARIVSPSPLRRDAEESSEEEAASSEDEEGMKKERLLAMGKDEAAAWRHGSEAPVCEENEDEAEAAEPTSLTGSRTRASSSSDSDGSRYEPESDGSSSDEPQELDAPEEPPAGPSRRRPKASRSRVPDTSPASEVFITSSARNRLGWRTRRLNSKLARELAELMPELDRGPPPELPELLQREVRAAEIGELYDTIEDMAARFFAQQGAMLRPTDRKRTPDKPKRRQKPAPPTPSSDAGEVEEDEVDELDSTDEEGEAGTPTRTYSSGRKGKYRARDMTEALDVSALRAFAVIFEELVRKEARDIGLVDIKQHIVDMLKSIILSWAEEDGEPASGKERRKRVFEPGDDFLVDEESDEAADEKDDDEEEDEDEEDDSEEESESDSDGPGGRRVFEPGDTFEIDEDSSDDDREARNDREEENNRDNNSQEPEEDGDDYDEDDQSQQDDPEPESSESESVGPRIFQPGDTFAISESDSDSDERPNGHAQDSGMHTV